MTDLLPAILRRAVELGALNPPGKSLLHGEKHWKAVALTGLYLARETPGASLPFIYTFAMLHDVMRENDDEDPGHGARAAGLFVRLVIDGIEQFPPYEPHTLALMQAIQDHTEGDIAHGTCDDLNVGLCWDADRLNLWRVGIEPAAEFLTTDAAKRTGAKMLTYGLCEKQRLDQPFPTWAEIEREMEQWRWP